MKKSLLTLFLLLNTFSALFGQEVDTVWIRRYNGPANLNDYPSALTLDDSGNVYIAGQSFSYNSGYDYATLKYHPDGELVWLKRYNGTGNYDDGATALALDDSGNLYVTGWSVGTGTFYNFDYVTIKYQPDGETTWVRRYPGPVADHDDAATAITIDSAGNIYVTGHSWDLVTYDDYATFKYYPDGDTAWLRRYNDPANGYDHPKDLSVDPFGNLCLTGLSSSRDNGFDYATIKYYPDSDTAWLRRYNGPGNSDDDACAIAVDVSGNIYVTGTSYDNLADDDYATLKYYPDGDTAWVRRYNGTGNFVDQAADLALDRLGNICVTGKSYDSLTYFDYATVKYDSGGNQLWVRRYNGPGNGNDEATAIATDDSGNVYVTGGSFGNGTDFDFATLKYDPSGNLLWLKRFNGGKDDKPTAIAIDSSGNVFVTGQSYQGETKYDYVTIKYNQIIFYRGDVNRDGKVSISDIVYLINYLFKGGPPPDPLTSADCNCDGKPSISDVVFLINYLFKGGPPPSC
jgi:uncharacterized delta-60 repeat protein